MIKPLREALEESYTKIKEQEIAQLYASCYKTAWETTLFLEEDGKSYVPTGDIHAMWLRDSAMQLLPYLSMADIDVVARALRGRCASASTLYSNRSLCQRVQPKARR